MIKFTLYHGNNIIYIMKINTTNQFHYHQLLPLNKRTINSQSQSPPPMGKVKMFVRKIQINRNKTEKERKVSLTLVLAHFW